MSYESTPAGILNEFQPQNDHASVAGERRLWRAILRKAFEDVKGLHLHGTFYERNTIQVSAGEWFMSDAQEPGSFLWVCSQLGLDPSALRRRLHELNRKAH
jgi:hypothetical protein